MHRKSWEELSCRSSCRPLLEAPGELAIEAARCLLIPFLRKGSGGSKSQKRAAGREGGKKSK